MKTGGGDFSAEAYEQLREAYAKEQAETRSVEEKGHDIMGLNLGLETAPVDSPWADKIDNWTYPSGKSQYLDEHQDPAEILQLMREAAQERINAKDGDEEEVEEEEEVLEESEEESQEPEEDEESDEEDDEDDEDDEDEDEDEEDEEDDEDEEEDDDEEVDEEDESEDDDELDVTDIAYEISQLRSELESMQFVSEEETDDES